MKKYFSNVLLYFLVIWGVLGMLVFIVGAITTLILFAVSPENKFLGQLVVSTMLGVATGGSFIAAFLWPWPKDEEEEDEFGEGDWVEIRTFSKLIRNAAMCNHCGNIVESKSVHDFVSCSCFKNEEGNRGIAVDGGLEYCRRIGCLDDYTELSKSEEYRISQFKPKRSTP